MGVVSALGPFVTDFYLPALPALTNYFCTSATMVQLTLTVSMVGLAVGQLFIGPLSDRYGRKPFLLLSLSLFSISTAASLFSVTIGQFILFRFIQGVAGAGGVVLSKSIAADLFEGKKLVSFFSVLSSVQGLAPICAPVLGGLLLTVTDWRGIFGVLLLLGVVLFIVALGFRETLLVSQGSLWATFKNYVPVLRNSNFMRYVMVQAMAMGVMFTYIASSPFIFQQHYGLTPFVYSLYFGINALGIMAGSFLSIRFGTPQQALRFGARGFFLLSVVVCGMLIGDFSVISVEVALFLMLFCLGLILPTSTTLSLELAREYSGSASAVLGFMTFFVGGICSPLTGLGDMTISTSIIIFICAGSTFWLAMVRK